MLAAKNMIPSHGDLCASVSADGETGVHVYGVGACVVVNLLLANKLALPSSWIKLNSILFFPSIPSGDKNRSWFL